MRGQIAHGTFACHFIFILHSKSFAFVLVSCEDHGICMCVFVCVFVATGGLLDALKSFLNIFHGKFTFEVMIKIPNDFFIAVK